MKAEVEETKSISMNKQTREFIFYMVWTMLFTATLKMTHGSYFLTLKDTCFFALDVFGFGYGMWKLFTNIEKE
tara:strand:- start:1249 stop:1467 length:219 start_codon:yes stop_codon:yes gene_type:complete